MYLSQGQKTTKNYLEDTCLGANYLERGSVITKLHKFKFIPAQEHVFMIATNKWIISFPIPFSTSVQCNNMFTLIN
jgi:hypothetical protein